MTLEDIERQEDERIQYELQLLGAGGKRYRPLHSGQERRREPEAGPVRVKSSEDYILTLEKVKR